MEKYSTLNEVIRRLNKATLTEIIKGQKEELLEQRCKQGRGDFLKKLAGDSSIQGVNTI